MSNGLHGHLMAETRGMAADRKARMVFRMRRDTYDLFLTILGPASLRRLARGDKPEFNGVRVVADLPADSRESYRLEERVPATSG